jgi:ubiquinone/menaquinone biosynthesis C-methylase UbiE
MNEQEWDKMRAFEDYFWWYKALHRFLLRLIWTKTNSTKTPFAVLDVGCGTGGFMMKLARTGHKVFGFDISPVGILHANNRGLRSVSVASANNFPFKDESFDMVTCIDVLESKSLSPEAVVKEALRVLKPGGCGLFQMAAHQWLMSEHDRAVHSVRRFNMRQLRNLLQNLDFQIIYATYFFFLLFPVMSLWKITNRPKSQRDQEKAVSDVKPINPYLNEFLYAICCLEAVFLPWIALPMGTSVCVVVRKNGQ